MGKTAFATNIAYNIAKAHRGQQRADGHLETVDGGIVGFFSLEMSAEQLATRIISERTGIPSSTIRRGGITETDFEAIKDVSIELQELPFYIDETGGLSIAQLAARARRLKRQRGMPLSNFFSVPGDDVAMQACRYTIKVTGDTAAARRCRGRRGR